MPNWIMTYRFQLLVTLCLIFTPFLIYLHLLFDENSTVNLLGHEINHGYQSTQYYIWLVLSSNTAFIFLSLMFFSLSQRWKYALFLPLSLFLENILGLLNAPYDLHFSKISQLIISILIFITIYLVLDYFIFKEYRNKPIKIELNLVVKKRTVEELNRTTNKILEVKSCEQSKDLKDKLKALYSNRLILHRTLKAISSKPVGVYKRNACNYCLLYLFLIVFSSSTWFVYNFIPEGVANYDIGPLKIGSYGFADAHTFTWYISRRIVVLVPIILWFFHSSSWWRYAILSPLILYFFQFWETFQSSLDIDTAIGNSKVFPLVFISILLVMTLSRFAKHKSKALDTYDKISEEIDHLIQKLSEERTGLAEYKIRYAKILDKLIKRNAGDLEMDELRQLEEELRAKIV